MSANGLLPPELVIETATDPALDYGLQLEEAALVLDLESWIIQRLKHCRREITLNLPIVRNDGEAINITGYRVQHCDARGPYMGPVLFSPDIHLNALRERATALSWQYALLDLPFGGSTGALICDTRRMPESELQDVARKYVAALQGLIGANSDITMCAEKHIAAWMWDSYVRGGPNTEAGAITGKPAAIGGLTPGHIGASLAVSAIAGKLLTDRWEDRRISIQGFGDEARQLARWFVSAGARLVALADISGGLLNDRGLNLPDIEKHVTSNGVLYGFPNADAVRNSDVLSASCDVLILAAAERQLTGVNAHAVQAELIFELAHSAVTNSAEKLLADRGHIVVPEALATCGTAVASFLEWRGAWGLEPAQLDSAVQSSALRALRLAQETSDRLNSTLRMGALAAGMERVAEAIRLER